MWRHVMPVETPLVHGNLLYIITPATKRLNFSHSGGWRNPFEILSIGEVRHDSP